MRSFCFEVFGDVEEYALISYSLWVMRSATSDIRANSMQILNVDNTTCLREIGPWKGTLSFTVTVL